jgi:ElaB/YqjD/DUF883 family membrane-anchored ribosome-binding protein
MAQKRSKTAQKARDKVNTTASKARKAIDEVDDAVSKTKQKARAGKTNVKYKAKTTTDRVAQAKQEAKQKVDSAGAWVKKNPGKAVAGAAAVGWLTAKLFGRRR